MKITHNKLRQIIKEELNEIQLPFLEPIYAAGLKVVSSIPDAWSSLKSGESFSFEVPDSVAEALKTLLGGDSWTPGSALTLKESKRILTENPTAIIAGIGAGLLIIVLVAMVKGYSTDVEIGGKVAGQSGKAKIVLKAPSDSGQVNIGTQQGAVEPDLSDALSEAIMVSLNPITSRPPSTMESRWAKLSGIPEEYINLSETVVDTGLFDAAIRNAVTAWQEVSDEFGDSMMMIWEEDPAMMSKQGYKDKSEWQQQVTYAQKELGDAFSLEKIEAKIQEVESMLHGGQFYDDREYQGFQKDSGPSDGPLDYDSDGKLDADELRDIADDLEG